MGTDDGGTSLPLRFGLFGHDVLHVVGNSDVLEADAGNINAPFGGFGINNFLDLITDLLAVGQKLIKLNTADNPYC